MMARNIRTRTCGARRGPITRLVSPSDLGELIKPFVFLDLAEIPAGPEGAMRWHPHSGIATVTLILEGKVDYQETTGVKGQLAAGGVEWMAAGSGVWHTGAPSGGKPVRGFQLWVALPPEREMGAPESRYLDAEDVPHQGPARILLGRLGSAASPIDAPAGINYLDVRLKPGERWDYLMPDGHEVAWLAVYSGSLECTEPASTGELLIFEEGNGAISITSEEGVGFVLGSAVKHPHELHLGNHSVHTSADSLREGEAQITRIAGDLRKARILA
ncbi:pirin family protein [Sphingomonas sp. LaA6.9]|uniref:pirin family protein n=1 Tax=Sphingomonas sp. LaA6.9 TaxID=2919914 RepID=UPI001F4F68B3|nr:pirin family protein [Sphingomonas sp. LaA6.9]MCJ8159016.1 pirin family protein [Sphingomonas sp. LaA6.9]